MDAIQYLLHLHSCEQEGITSGMPTPQQWIDAVEAARKQHAEQYSGENKFNIGDLFPINGFRIDVFPSEIIVPERGVGKLYVHPEDYKQTKKP